MELEYADGNRGKSPTSIEGSQGVGEVPMLVDKVSDSRCEISSHTPVNYGCVHIVLRQVLRSRDPQPGKLAMECRLGA